jgi:hypothetical protein
MSPAQALRNVCLIIINIQLLFARGIIFVEKIPSHYRKLFEIPTIMN